MKTRIYICSIDSAGTLEYGTDAWKKACLCLERQRQEQIGRFRNEPDKVRSLAAGLLLRYGLGRYFGSGAEDTIGRNGEGELPMVECESEDCQKPWPETCQEVSLRDLLTDGVVNGEPLKIELGEHDKPSLADYPDIFYNLSHSGDYAALIISEVPCGIDIQKRRELSGHFLERFFHEEEREWLRSCAGRTGDILNQALRLFSLKEAVVKCSGHGIGRGMERFNAVPLLEGRSIREEGHDMIGKIYAAPEGYSMAAVIALHGESV